MGTLSAVGGNLTVVGGSTTPTTGTPPSTYDSGLSETFQDVPASTGTTRSILSYGAVSGNTSVDSRAAINNAITASTAGDVVYIPDGTYYLKGSTINVPAGIRISGQSKTGTVLATMFSASRSSIFKVASGASNVVYENFSVRKQSGSDFDAVFRFSDQNLSPSAAAVTRCAIKNIKIQHHKRFAIEAHNTKHLLVDGCTISDAVALDGGGQGYGVLITDPAATNNWVRNCTIGTVIRHAVVLQNLANHNLIGGKLSGTPCGNTIVGCVADAVDCHGELEYSNEIAYNLIHDNVRNGTTQSPNGAGFGIGEPPTDTTLGGSGHDRSGEWNWIHHNEVYNCPQGIRVMNQSNNTVIEDNYFHGNDDGILLDQVSGYSNTGVDTPQIKRNTITGNGNGIRLTDIVTNAVVQNNTITGNTGYGIYGDSNTTGYVITGNTVSGNGTNVQLDNPSGTYS